MSKQLLYVMKNEFGLFKIGISNNPNRRVKELSNTSGVPCEIVKVFDTYNTPAFTVEQSLHKHFTDTRKAGEWFSDVDLVYM